MTRLVAFDLDGTLTQHKSPMSTEIRAALDALRAHGYALSRLCGARGLAKEEVLYVGDDYAPGGNDESVLLVGFPFLRIDDYRATPAALRARLLPPSDARG